MDSGCASLVITLGRPKARLLAVEDGGLGKTGGLQLCPRGERTVYFWQDPAGPPTMKLTKVDAP